MKIEQITNLERWRAQSIGEFGVKGEVEIDKEFRHEGSKSRSGIDTDKEVGAENRSGDMMVETLDDKAAA